MGPEIKRDPNAPFYSETTAGKHFAKKKVERLIPVRPGSGNQTKTLMEAGIPVKNPYDLQKPCVDIAPRPEDIGGIVRVVRPTALDSEKINAIRTKLRQKNVGPSYAGNLLKPGSRMNMRTTSMIDFKSKSTNRVQPIIPEENNALKHPGKISEDTVNREQFARPASSCYGYEDFYIYC